MTRWDNYGAIYHEDPYEYMDGYEEDALYHHGILGMKWGRRRWQNEDGSLTEAGRAHYGYATERESNRHSEKNREYDYKMQKSRDSVSKVNAYRDIRNKKLEVDKYKSGLGLSKQRDANAVKRAQIAAESKKNSEAAKLAEMKQKEHSEMAKLNQKSKLDIQKAKDEYKLAKLNAKTAREAARSEQAIQKLNAKTEREKAWNEYALAKLKEKNNYTFDRHQQDYDYVYDRIGQAQDHAEKKQKGNSFIKGLAVAGITAAALHVGANYVLPAIANSHTANTLVANANPQTLQAGANTVNNILNNATWGVPQNNNRPVATTTMGWTSNGTIGRVPVQGAPYSQPPIRRPGGPARI